MKSEGPVAAALRSKLEAAFSPQTLEIVDDSSRHAGHEGAREGGESHFTVTIAAEAFSGRSRVERQRLVNQALRDELAGPVHALSIKALAPGEA
jgi:BolA protein